MRSAVRTARRRLDGGEPSVASTVGDSPCCASAATTKPRFSARVASSGIICSAQPPQLPKCRQSGATRSGLGWMISTMRARLPLRSTATRSPGSVNGT